MPRVITAEQAMSHPTVVATINCLSEMTQRLQDENDELKAALAQSDAFEQGRQEGVKQERALWELSKLGQEIEAQPEQEPVAWVNTDHLQGLTLGLYGYVEIYIDESIGDIPLYTTPPQRKPLTDERIHGIFYPLGIASEAQLHIARACARAIEAAHGIKE